MEISLTLTTLIFLFVVCLCGGIAIGAMFGRARKPEAKPEVEQKPQQAELPPPPPRLANEEDVEILRAWRSRGESLWLEMDGKRLENKNALDANQKKRLLKLVLDLRPWLDVQPAAPVPVAAPRPPVQEPPRPAAQPSIFSTRPPKAEPKPDEEKPKVSLKSIVEQIDEVLQQKLAGTVFEDREIRLIEGAGGAVIVQVKNERFEGIEAVPDAEIRALIRQAVTEWEKGNG
jgi:hypothetical protein